MNRIRTMFAFCLSCALVVLMLQGGTALGQEQQSPQAKPDATAKEGAAKGETAVKSAPQKSPNDPMARVNGTIITRGEVDRAVKVLLAQNKTTQPLTPEQTKQVEDATLDQLIAWELLYQAGTKLEVKDADKLVDEKIAQGKARFPSTAEYDKALKANDLTEKDLRELTRKDVYINKVIEKEVASKITITDADIKKFYDDNQDKFKKEESVKASHILCGVDANASPEDKKKAKEKAEALLKKIKAGEDFAKLAKENSTCPSSAQGGDLGFFGRGQMVPPFESAAFALKPGEVSDVVETQFGYHIIKVTDKKNAEVVKLDDVKDRIKEYLKNQKMQKAVADYVAELKTKAKVEKLL